jgi:polysaccharide biosynthesis/export protein
MNTNGPVEFYRVSIHSFKQARTILKEANMKKIFCLFRVVALFVTLFAAVSVCIADDASYVLGPGDVLEISVWKDESLSRKVIIPPDGVVSFPLVGDININQMTVTILRETIRKKLSEYIPDATVTVMLSQINSLTAYVVGKVNKPGQFPIDLKTTVMQILSMAGGLNPFADEGQINILRQSGTKTTRIVFDYKDVSKGVKLEQNILIQRGDVVMVN